MEIANDKDMAGTVLLVEDSQSTRDLVVFTLEDAGFRVIEAENGRDALQKLSGIDVSLIITDLNMPEMNGIEFVRNIRMREDYSMVPILILSTETLMSRINAAIEAGASGWVGKPFIPGELISKVRKLVAVGSAR